MSPLSIDECDEIDCKTEHTTYRVYTQNSSDNTIGLESILQDSVEKTVVLILL